MELKLQDYSSAWLIGLVFLFVIVVKKTLAYRRLRHFKGPPGTGLTDFFHAKEMIGPRLHDWYQSISERYGKTRPEIISYVDFFRPKLTFEKDPSLESRRISL